MGPKTSLGQFWRRENLLLLAGLEPQTIQLTKWSTSRPSQFTPKKEPPYPLNRRKHGPQTIQPKDSCYTDYAMPAGKAFIFSVKLPNKPILLSIPKICFKNIHHKNMDTRRGLDIMGSLLIFQVTQLSEAAKCSNMGYVYTSIL
jgi:hypothetical protein